MAKAVIVLITFICFLIPILTVFSSGVIFSAFNLSRVFGLWLLTLVAFQVCLQGYRDYLGRIFGAVTVQKAHITIGTFTLFYVFLHPIFVYWFYYQQGGVDALFNIISPFGGGPYILLGKAAFFLLLLTILTAIFRRKIRWWRTIHYLNYAVFYLGLFHSVFLGTDTKNALIMLLWIVYSILVSGVLVRRIVRFPPSRSPLGLRPTKSGPPRR